MKTNYWTKRQELASRAALHTVDMDVRYADEIQDCIADTVYYNTVDLPNSTPSSYHTCTVLLEDMDSVSAIFKYNDNVSISAVLNFASYTNPGGKFIEGSSAQEESLCHQSYLYNILKNFPDYYEYNKKHKNNSLYTNQALYTPFVRFFTTSTDTCFCDVITCAAPNLSPAIRFNNTDVLARSHSVLKDRIKFVLDIACKQEVNTLILGAFGCGVFQQDIIEVLTIFKYFLEDERYSQYFSKVIFAIPRDVNTDNYDKAAQLISNYQITTTPTSSVIEELKN